jgi:hypothetical protein
LPLQNTILRYEGVDETMQHREKAGEGTRRKFLAAGMAFVLAAVLLLAGSGEAATWTVTSEADDGSIDTLRDVVDRAADGDRITFSSSVSTVSLKELLFITKALTIEGPVTIRQTTPGARVLYIVGDCTLDRLTITGGRLGDGYGAYGAGVYCHANVTMKNCIVTNNTGGGGIHNSKNLVLQSCTISNNSAGSLRAGGIGSTILVVPGSTSLTMTDCLIENNTSSGYAGGIYNGVFGTITMARTIVRNNSNTTSGGGMALNSLCTTTMMDHSVVSGNTPDNISCWGGVAYSADNTCTIGDAPNKSATAFAGFAGDTEPEPRSIADDPDVTAVESALADSGSDLFGAIETALSNDLGGTSGNVTATLAGITASLYYANTFEDVAIESRDLAVEYTASWPEHVRYYSLFARADGSGYEIPERGVQFEIKPGQDLPEGVTPPDFYEEGEGLMTWRNVVADGGPYDLNDAPGVVTFRVCSVRAAAPTSDPGGSGGCNAGTGAGFAPLALLLALPLLHLTNPKRGLLKRRERSL